MKVFGKPRMWIFTVFSRAKALENFYLFEDPLHATVQWIFRESLYAKFLLDYWRNFAAWNAKSCSSFRRSCDRVDSLGSLRGSGQHATRELEHTEDFVLTPKFGMPQGCPESFKVQINPWSDALTISRKIRSSQQPGACDVASFYLFEVLSSSRLLLRLGWESCCFLLKQLLFVASIAVPTTKLFHRSVCNLFCIYILHLQFANSINKMLNSDVICN